ncbi:MAG: ATP-binding cassette domain-containing protein, partial [Planctomycetes bacterium]|nr:ATP-binding cassette domain-containing protein [Planctomycetota bacterium]
MDSETELAVSMRKVWATRAGRPILRDINWNLRRGEIHALVGEHSSGKTTLAGIVCGEASRDGGELVIRGRKIDSITPRQARNLGVAILGQESRLIECMSVAENIFLGCRSFRPLNGRRMQRNATEWLSRLGMADVPPALRIRELPENARRMVEIVKAIVDDPAILILDEVSQRFTPEEMEKIYLLLRDWRNQGKSAIFISPTLDEALESCDRVTFLSSGIVRGTEDVDKLDRYRILNLTFPSLASREKLRAANVELYNYKRYNENLIRNLPLGVVIIDPQNCLHLINRSAAEVFHLDPAACIGQNLSNAFPEEITAFLRTADMEAGPFAEELDIGGIALRLTVFPLNDDDDGVLGTVLL